MTNKNTELLIEIRDLLRRIERSSAPAAPNYRRRLSEFADFDWSSIGARIVASDERGPVEVESAGHRFDRAGGEKFDSEFIIFSRPAPGWSQENKKYFTLIKFADYNKTPLDQDPPGDSPTPTTRATRPGPAPPPPAEDERFKRRLENKKQPAPACELCNDVPTRLPCPKCKNSSAKPQVAQPITADQQPINGHATWNKLVEMALLAGKFDHTAVNNILGLPTGWLDKAKLLADHLDIDLSQAMQAA